MFTYSYKAVTKDHKSIVSTIKSYSAWLARKRLEKDGTIVLFIERKYASHTKSLGVLHKLAQLSSYSQILFFRNFSMMLESGISMSQTIETLAGQVKGIGVHSALERMKKDVTNGKTLSSAMARYPRLFPKHITKTVEIGERSGTLALTMDRISTDIEKNYELRRKVIGAIMYPMIIISFMILTSLLLVVFVLPQLTAMFNELGTPVPKMTQYLQVVGTFIVAYPIQIILALLVILVCYILLMRLRHFRIVVHGALLHVPIFGPLLLEYNLVRLTRALNTLVSSGITFPQAVEVSKGTLNNEAFRSSLERIYPVVLHGGSFSDAIRSMPRLYPDQLLQLIIVGEQSGRLSFALEKASVHYERSVAFQTQMLTTLIEPILMLIAGVLVGSLAYSMFAPLYKIAGSIQ